MTRLPIRGRIAQMIVKQLRDEGNTISDIARFAGVSRPTVYAWMNGQTPHWKNLHVLDKLAGGGYIPSEEEQRNRIDIITGKRLTDE